MAVGLSLCFYSVAQPLRHWEKEGVNLQIVAILGKHGKLRLAL
jgi:hypothetical protein